MSFRSAFTSAFSSAFRSSYNADAGRFVYLLDKYVGAAAAFSLSKLSKNTANVVRVRRVSDNNEDDFSADDVSTGAMTGWVNTNFNVKTYDFSTNNGGLGFTSNLTLAGGESAGGVGDALKISVVSTGGNAVHRVYQNLNPLGSGSGFRITFKAYRPSSNVSVGKLGFSFASGFLSSNVSPQFFSADDVWEDFSFDANSGTNTRFYVQLSATNGVGSLKSVFNGVTGDHVFIKDLKIDVVNSSGHVTEWYDQSGNGNDLTQPTAANQPKVVSFGALVSGGVDFDGANDYLPISTTLSWGEYTAFTVERYKGSGSTISYGRTGGSGRHAGSQAGGTQVSLFAGGTTCVDNGDTTIEHMAYRYFRNSIPSASRMAYNDNSLSSTGAAGVGNNTLNNMAIGAELSSISAYGNVTVNALIIYNSNQSANRTGISAKLNSIIPTY